MARDFNGTNENLNIDSAILTAYPFTMGGWASVDDVTSDQFIFSINDSAASASRDEWGLVIRGSVAGDPIIGRSTVAGTSVDATTSTGVTSGQWHHIALVGRSATSRDVYIDGGSKGSNITSSTPTGLNRTRFGESGSSGGDYNGRAAEFGVWSVAFSDAEIAAWAKKFAPPLFHLESLVAYWPLLGRHSPEPDYVGGFNLTPTGTTQSAHPPIIPMMQRIGGIKKIVAVAAGSSIFRSSIFKSPIFGGRIAA